LVRDTISAGQRSEASLRSSVETGRVRRETPAGTRPRARRAGTFFDVGANIGLVTFAVGARRPDLTIHAFEPTPALAATIRDRASALPNYHLVEAAVDESPGVRFFNVAELGCGSLLDLSDQDWLGDDVEGEVRVRVARLDTELGALGIDRVDFLHCDAQGNDLRVLRSLGDIAVREGVIEVPARSKLYDGGHEQNVHFHTSSAPLVLRRLAFSTLGVLADVRVVPHRIRVAVGMRSRLRRLANAQTRSFGGSARHAHLSHDD
jgi:FkbM family methyltransferase